MKSGKPQNQCPPLPKRKESGQWRMEIHIQHQSPHKPTSATSEVVFHRSEHPETELTVVESRRMQYAAQAQGNIPAISVTEGLRPTTRFASSRRRTRGRWRKL